MSNHLCWEEAPEWATHIVAMDDTLDFHVWARRVGNRYYSETFKDSLAASFAMHYTDTEEGGWVILSERPNAAAGAAA